MTASHGDRLVEHPPVAYLRPVVMHHASHESETRNKEQMFPMVNVVECPQEKMLKAIGPTLICSAITNDEGFRRELINSIDIDRLNLGPIPTPQLDWLQPHEGNLIEFLYRSRALQVSRRGSAGNGTAHARGETQMLQQRHRALIGVHRRFPFRMHEFDFHCPTRIVFGPGRFVELGALTASGLGVSRVLVVSDPGIEEAGHTKRGVESLQKAGLETRVFDGLQENPTTDHVDRGVEAAKDFRPDAIVAIGGGSSMDCAKGINFLYSCGGRMQDYWGVGKATGPMLPMVAAPTTAGTGSEAQSFALISDAQTHAKMACGDKRAAFRVAVLDPELTLTQPPRVTALTGIDAIAHTVETLVSKKRNQVSLAFSREAWRLLSQGFPRVLEDPKDLTARGWVQQGACLAGLAIENSMLGAAHALANPLTAAYGIVHGQAVGMMLPHVVSNNAERSEGARRAYEELAHDIAPADHENPALVKHEVEQFLMEMLEAASLKQTLSELGVHRDRLPELAADAATQWTGTFNPVEMTADDYQRLYEAAY